MSCPIENFGYHKLKTTVIAKEVLEEIFCNGPLTGVVLFEKLSPLNANRFVLVITTIPSVAG